jgi:hypothetical protein
MWLYRGRLYLGQHLVWSPGGKGQGMGLRVELRGRGRKVVSTCSASLLYLFVSYDGLYSCV